MKTPTQEEAKRIFTSAFIEEGDLLIEEVEGGIRISGEWFDSLDGDGKFWRCTMRILNLGGSWYGEAANELKDGDERNPVPIDLEDMIRAIKETIGKDAP